MITEKERRHMLLREEVVAELREVIERYPKSSKISNLRTAVLHRTAPELGVSNAEVGKAFYPEKFEKNYGYGVACFHARCLIKRLKRSMKKMNVEFHAAKVTVPGCGEKWLYYNMQDKDDPNFRKVELHRKAMVNGVEKSQAELMQVLEMNPRARRRHTDELMNEIDVAYGYSERLEDIDVTKYLNLQRLEDKHAKKAGTMREVSRRLREEYLKYRESMKADNVATRKKDRKISRG
jgi:hypothetical protein